MKKHSTSFATGEMQTETTLQIHLPLNEVSVTEKPDNEKLLVGLQGTKKFSTLLVRV